MKSWKVHYQLLSKTSTPRSCGLEKCKHLICFLLLTGLGLYITYTLYSHHLMMPDKNPLVPSQKSVGMVNDTNWQRRVPNALIIGSAKSGTRALLVSLKIHPDVRSYPKELHFFNEDEKYAQGIEWYRKQMPFSFPGQITIEKTPGYFTSPKVPERVHKMNKDVRLLLIVRDPTIRAISAYTQLLENRMDMPPFETYVTKDSKETAINTESTIIRDGVYVKHLSRWLQYFPLSQIHIIRGEDLIEHPAAVLKSTQQFLGLKPFITEKNFYFNKTKGFQCFIGKIKFDGKRTSGCLNSRKGRKHPEIRDSTRKMVQDYYRPFNQEFYKVAQRDFHWPIEKGGA